jgi:hypothetical protein
MARHPGKRSRAVAAAFWAALLFWGAPFWCGAFEVSGSVNLEASLFPHSPRFAGQRSQAASLAVNAEFYQPFAGGDSLIFSPFARLDSADTERSHVDLREFNYLHVGDGWELRFGLAKVFWGACEFVHLVDIINQTDLVEALDGEEKLGQPMVHLSLVRDWGVVDAFLLPWFRERTFVGVKGRLRPALVVDTDHPLYESASEESHQDVALRYSRSLAGLDVGLAYFRGTSREPWLVAAFNDRGEAVLRPSYEQIGQASLDLQAVFGPWLLKAEALHRTGAGRDFAAITAGFEYTLVGLFDSDLDLGLLGEYVFDDRPKDRVGIFDHDLMAGLRLAFNDAASSQILVGLVQDLEHSSRLLTVEAGRRLADRFHLNAEAVFFMGGAASGIEAALADDDFVKVELVAYF